jgi:hypothetical protein
MVALIVGALGFLWWMIIVVAWAMFLLITVAFARSKGRSGLFWGILACFFPLITIIVLLLIPSRAQN